VAEESGAFFWSEGAEGLSDAAPQVWHGALGSFAQKSLELCEGQFYGVEVRRIRRQVAQLGAGGLDKLAHALDLVSRQVVHDDGVALAQGRNQYFLDVDQKGRSIHWPVENERGDQPAAPQTGGKGGGFPVTPGNLGKQPCASRASATNAHHLGVGAGLVDEHQPIGIKAGLTDLPVLPRLSDVGSGLLAGVQAFF